jgi:hypothetical protein
VIPEQQTRQSLQSKEPSIMSSIININKLTSLLRASNEKEKPATSNKFPKTKPVNEAKTIPSSPFFSEKNEIISSTAFPNIAWSNPPIRGPIHYDG